MDLKRIVELEEQATVDDGVYTIIDSVSATAKKFPLGKFIEDVYSLNKNTSVSGDPVIYCAKSGNLATITTGSAIAARAWSAYESVLIGTIPTGYRPARETNIPVPTSDRSMVFRAIFYPDGRMYIYNPGAAITAQVSVVAFSATYALV